MLKKILIASSFLGLAETAQAFTAADDMFTNSSFGSCNLRRYVRASQQRAYFYLSTRNQVTGGTYFWNNTIRTHPAITEASIASCLGVSTSDVTINSQNGANGTYASDTYMGLVFTLTRAGNGYGVGTHEISLTGSSANTPASANAGPNQNVSSGSTVTLNGTNSSANDAGQTLTYSWSQLSGPAVTLSSTTAPQPSFTAPNLPVNGASAVLVFELTVNDGFSSATSQVAVTVAAPVDVTPPNAPTINISQNSDGSITVSGSAEVGSTVIVTFPDGSTQSVTASNTGNYTATSPANQVDGTVQVVARDGAGNTSAAATASYLAPQVAAATTAIENFQTSRRTQLLANQPNLRTIAFGRSGGFLRADATRAAGDFDFGADLPMSAWVRLRGSWSEQGTRDTTYAFGAVGTHRAISPDFIIGGMLQYDFAKETDVSSTTEGQGWLVGPYVAIKHPDQPLYFDGSLLYGRSQNEVSPVGTFTDSFDSERWLATAQISGDVSTENAVWTPYLGASYAKDTSEAYTDGMGSSIPEVSQSNIQISAGVDVTVPVDVEVGRLDVLGGISGHYDILKASGASSANNSETGYARVTVGFHYQPDDETDIRANVFVDGLGSNGYRGQGIELLVERHF